MDQKTRSRMMSGIKSANTKPEILLRKALHSLGYRFRIHDRRLPGTPDIVLPKWRVAIQVHGCFWHRHPGCPKATTPANNAEFWQAKFDANLKRDAAAAEKVLLQGWRLLVVWECAAREFSDGHTLDEVVGFIEEGAASPIRFAEIGSKLDAHQTAKNSRV
ncbi:MAG: very short patch repair endonuclease [Rhodobacteraceae bacterium]|nr:very short patch repair endonuclease [Paracoccaceae bacterium]